MKKEVICPAPLMPVFLMESERTRPSSARLLYVDVTVRNHPCRLATYQKRLAKEEYQEIASTH